MTQPTGQHARALAAMLCLLASPGLAGDAERGRALAERWCQSCHVVGPDATGGDAGPAFAAVAGPDGLSEGALRAWLFAPHEPMPDLDLGPAEIEDIVAYIDTLAPGEGG